MKELRSIKGGEKWKDVAWVEKCARERIAKMELVFTGPSLCKTAFNAGPSWPQSDIPAAYMKVEIRALVKRWHVQRASDGGAQELVDKMAADNGKGLQCPWTGCHSWYPAAAVVAFETLENYMDHLQLYHWNIFIFGDTDWLIGHPSRWWLGDVPRGGIQLQDQAHGGEITASDSVQPEVRQAAWLRQWWPDRWEKENIQVLEGWRDNGGFYGENLRAFW